MQDAAFSFRRRRFALGLGALGLGAIALPRVALAQERFSHFVPSDEFAVERLIRISNLRDDDVVVDLGSGDGRIVFAAARANAKVRGFGVDIQEDLVRKANAQAQRDGLADRVKFLHQNAFDADLSNVTVIYMWLFPDLTRLLRTKILAEARPGTRVVVNSAAFSEQALLGNWRPDVTERDGHAPVLLWYVPARVEGYWNWEIALNGARFAYDAVMQQQFQVVEGSARVGNRRESFGETKLRGDELSFSFDVTLPEAGRTRHEFSGRVSGDQINGKVRLSMPEGRSMELPWLARRTTISAWFRPTGVDLK